MAASARSLQQQLAQRVRLLSSPELLLQWQLGLGGSSSVSGGPPAARDAMGFAFFATAGNRSRLAVFGGASASASKNQHSSHKHHQCVICHCQCQCQQQQYASIFWTLQSKQNSYLVHSTAQSLCPSILESCLCSVFIFLPVSCSFVQADPCSFAQADPIS